MAHPSDFHVIPAFPDPEPAHSSTHRPVHFADIIGQPRLIDRLSTHLNSAVVRGVQPGHVLLDGGAGLGKTTIAQAIATELADRGVRSTFHDVTGDAIVSVGKLALQLSALTAGDVLLVDEIHALRAPIQLALLRALEDRMLSVPGGSRSAAQRLRLPAFTLIGATTAPGRLSEPLRARFKLAGHLVPYSFDALQLVIQGHAERAGIALTTEASEIIARASRFTPRTALRLVEACRDYALDVTGDRHAKVDGETASQGLEYAEVDQYGLDERDRRVLLQLAEEFLGGPVGVAPLAASLGMDAQELTKDVEPYLVRAGLLALGPRGRMATRASYVAVGLSVPALVNGLLR